MRWLAVLVVAGCGGTAAHPAVRYDTDLDPVLAAADDVAKQNAKQVELDREHAAVHTAWQIVAVTSEQAAAYDFRAMGKVGAKVRYFARYDISVVGPRPYQVVVAAHASRWLEGDAKPSVLPDESPPAWLVERHDRIADDIRGRLRGVAREDAR